MKPSMVVATILAAASAAASVPVSAQSVSLSAVLLGGNECDSTVPPRGPICRKGDSNGFGRATLTFPTATRVCVTLQVSGLAGATAAHIHKGRETVNGPVVINLPPPVAPGGANPGASSACVAQLAATLTAIRTNPRDYYVNVHNAGFPNGAVRGQLF
jgi:hypothetical protein